MEKRRKIQSETSFLLLELFCPSITTLPDNGVDSDESDDDHMIEEWMVSEASPRRFSLWKGRISGRISPSFYPTASLHSRTMLSTGMTSDFLRFATTPKQIKELMKVDGLTNDEVKSHLQVCICDYPFVFNHNLVDVNKRRSNPVEMTTNTLRFETDAFLDEQFEFWVRVWTEFQEDMGNGLGCSVANSREMLQGRLALRYGKYGDEFEVV
ncbi:hypothetical protein EV1_037619 [Malus domestica]